METSTSQQQNPRVLIPESAEDKNFLMSAIGQELKEFELMQRKAQVYVSSTIVPKEYQGQEKIGNVIIALDMAKRLNANPLLIMQNLNVIQGKPAWSAKFLIATVNVCGRFEPLQYKFIERGTVGQVEYNETVYDERMRRNTYVSKVFDGGKVKNIECVAYTRRKGSAEILESSPVDIRTAVLEGWYTKKGSKWPTMTKQMLMYRAASWWANAYAPDISMGFMTTEEMQDTAVQDAEYEELKENNEARHIGFDDRPETQRPQAATVDEETGEVSQPDDRPETPQPKNAEDLFK